VLLGNVNGTALQLFTSINALFVHGVEGFRMSLPSERLDVMVGTCMPFFYRRVVQKLRSLHHYRLKKRSKNNPNGIAFMAQEPIS
jgi:hypothetical protein